MANETEMIPLQVTVPAPLLRQLKDIAAHAGANHASLPVAELVVAVIQEWVRRNPQASLTPSLPAVATADPAAFQAALDWSFRTYKADYDFLADR